MPRLKQVVDKHPCRFGGDELAETYRVFQAGTDLPYPTRNLPLVRALRGLRTHVEDMEIHQPDGSVTPLEVWGSPVYGARKGRCWDSWRSTGTSPPAKTPNARRCAAPRRSRP